MNNCIAPSGGWALGFRTDERSLVVAPIVADAEDKPLFMGSTLENDCLVEVKNQNGILWLNDRTR